MLRKGDIACFDSRVCWALSKIIDPDHKDGTKVMILLDPQKPSQRGHLETWPDHKAKVLLPRRYDIRRIPVEAYEKESV